MANFIRCKQDIFSYKRFSNEKIGDKIKIILFLFKTTEPVYCVKDKGVIEINNIIINLDSVIGLCKCKGHYVMCEDGEHSYIGNGIEFTTTTGTVRWIYDSEDKRNTQFEEIASNSHLFKQKVAI